MRRLAALLIACLVAAAAPSTQAPAPPVYENPVLPGDYPDPSVIRVGREYWATATTSQWAPIFPLLHSTDLVTWRRVGSVFQSPPAWSAGSYWAPEIAAHGGRFLVYYTARKKDGPLCVAVADAAAPQGPYTDRGPLVCQEVGSIDATPITDESGQRYLVWKEDGNSRKLPTPLWAQPLSPDGTKLTGERREILRNEASWEAHLIEGPYLLRRGDWFYMFYSADACCGRRCNYQLGVARARTLLGPWERHAANPILAGNQHWQCPGHGTIVDDPSGRTFLLYHAYHPVDFEYVGRQGLLDEVTWQADGWPAINNGRGPSHRASSQGGAAPARTTPIADQFDRAVLDPSWQWPWNQAAPPTVDPAGGGWLRLQTRTADIAVAARPAPAGSYRATASIDVASISPAARAGLAAFGNAENLLAVTVERRDGSNGTHTVTVWRSQKGERAMLATETIAASRAVHVRLDARDRTRFQFAVSRDGRDWRALGAAADGGFLPPWDLAVRVALLVSGKDASAAFDSYALETAATP